MKIRSIIMFPKVSSSILSLFLLCRGMTYADDVKTPRHRRFVFSVIVNKAWEHCLSSFTALLRHAPRHVALLD